MTGDGAPPVAHASATNQGQPPCLLIGIGNDYHGDDAVGLEIARRVRAAGLSGVAVLECTGSMVELLDSWGDLRMVALADAVRSGSPPGTVFRFDALSEVIGNDFARQVSSHGVGVRESIELARTLEQLPETLILFGIEGAAFELGAALSPEVEAAMDEVADRIVTELRSVCAKTGD